MRQGALVVLSGGVTDLMNPIEVRARMDAYAAACAPGLTTVIARGQRVGHVHHTAWAGLALALRAQPAAPLIVVGHSYGGAAAVALTRALAAADQRVDLLVLADAVTVRGDPVAPVPATVALTLNVYVARTWRWWWAPFPTGAQVTGAGAVLNVGLAYPRPGALAHRDAFLDLAGGVDGIEGSILLTLTRAVLRGDPLVLPDTTGAIRRWARAARVPVTVSDVSDPV